MQDLDNETLLHIDAENRRQTLEEELEFLKAVHEQVSLLFSQSGPPSVQSSASLAPSESSPSSSSPPLVSASINLSANRLVGPRVSVNRSHY